ncbi:hypothetical protein ACHAWU_004178 [Discostella pseudostelligera]|uniref:Uncharacterized protein n=1 Tax=Discostella pseudostelligera TaxID=259834 RepID=A0ABD3M1E2_9STRA
MGSYDARDLNRLLMITRSLRDDLISLDHDNCCDREHVSSSMPAWAWKMDVLLHARLSMEDELASSWQSNPRCGNLSHA